MGDSICIDGSAQLTQYAPGMIHHRDSNYTCHRKATWQYGEGTPGPESPAPGPSMQICLSLWKYKKVKVIVIGKSKLKTI